MSQKNILKQKVAIIIENVVATTTLDQNINIKKIVKAFHAKYNPDIFPGAIIRTNNPKVVILIFKSGSIVCTGAKSEEMVHTAIKRFVSELNCTTTSQNATFQNIKIVNMVASCNFNCKIHLEQAARILPRSMYEPDQFPGIIHRLSYPKTVALIFASGKLVCVGAKSTKEVYDSANTVHLQLEQMNLLISKD